MYEIVTENAFEKSVIIRALPNAKNSAISINALSFIKELSLNFYINVDKNIVLFFVLYFRFKDKTLVLNFVNFQLKQCILLPT